MTNEDLKIHIDTLHKQMEASRITADERDILSHLMTDIIGIAREKSDDSDISALQEKLEKQTIRLEQKHPAVADTLRQLMNTLSNMGI